MNQTQTQRLFPWLRQSIMETGARWTSIPSWLPLGKLTLEISGFSVSFLGSVCKVRLENEQQKWKFPCQLRLSHFGILIEQVLCLLCCLESERLEAVTRKKSCVRHGEPVTRLPNSQEKPRLGSSQTRRHRALRLSAPEYEPDLTSPYFAVEICSLFHLACKCI